MFIARATPGKAKPTASRTFGTWHSFFCVSASTNEGNKVTMGDFCSGQVNSETPIFHSLSGRSLGYYRLKYLGFADT